MEYSPSCSGVWPCSANFARCCDQGCSAETPPTVLTAEEEEELVGYCLNMQKLGFGLTEAAVNTTIMKIIKEQHRRHPFKDGPGTLGGSAFMRDHQQPSFRVPLTRAAKGNPLV